jgi:FkbM family methyltransferase
MLTNETSYVTKTLFWNGTENFEYTPIFEKLIVQCRTFLDVGANTGYYSIVAAKENKNIQVYAFEPSFGPAYFLKRNIEINKFNDQIRHYPIALSDRAGTIDFFEIRTTTTKEGFNLSGVGTTRKIFTSQENSSIVKVKAETLDSVVNEFGQIPVDLIKMDTEGTEDYILRGSSNTIAKHKPIIICETLFNQIEKDIESIMKGHGYEFYNHLRGRLYKTETLIRKEDNGVRDCFMVHPEKVHMIKSFIAS